MKYIAPAIVNVANANVLIQGMQTGQKAEQPFPDSAVTFSINPPAYEADE